MSYAFNYNYLRPKKATHLKTWYDNKFDCLENLQAFHLKNATILPLKRYVEDNLLFGRGGVVDNEGKYFDVSAIYNRVQGKYECEEIEYQDKKVVYCGYLVDHWGHFLVEGVARLWYFMKNDETVDRYVFFVNENENRQIQGNFKEFLYLLGIWDKLDIINKPIRYREVIVPELSRNSKESFSKEYKGIFEEVAKNVIPKDTWEKKDKIFLTRSCLLKARKYEFGLDMVDSFFENNGYKIIAPEKTSLSEMIFYVRNAKICSSIAGSASHNMLFANDGQKFIVLEKLILNDDDQPDINRLKELDAVNIDTISLYPTNYSGPCIFAYEGLLKKYAEDNGMLPPDTKYCKKSYIIKCFKKYIKVYMQEYGYKPFFDGWYLESGVIDYINEALDYGSDYFKDYVLRRKPLFWYNYFQWHFLKQFIRRIIKKK